MTVFRWIMGGLAIGFGGGAILSFVLFMAIDANAWLVRARRLRQAFLVVALFWFNVEIWGRVVWTLFHWNS